MRGSPGPERVNPAPAMLAAFTVTAALPVDERVSVCDAAAFTDTLPNERLDALMANAGVTAFSCSAKLCDAPPDVAVRLAVCAVLTAEIAAVNAAAPAPAAIGTEAGTLTALLLLARVTVVGLGVAATSVTVQESEPAPV